MGNHQRKLRQGVGLEISVEELKHKTKFTDQEIAEWHKIFLSECPSGLLGKDEFKLIFSRLFPYGEVATFSDAVFNILDSNNDNVIDFKEFLCALSTTSRGKIEDKLEWAFNMYDLDKDGFIMKTELLKVISSIYKMVGEDMKMPDDESSPEKRVEKIFNQMDTDNDGKLSLGEFVAGVLNDPEISKLLQTDPTLNTAQPHS